MEITKVDVHRNLKKGGFSIRSRESENYGIVIGHEDQVLVGDATFVVQEGGRQRAVEEGERNVHAFVRGKFLAAGDLPSTPRRMLRGWGEVTYDPFEYDSFVFASNEAPVHSAGRVILAREKCWIPGVKTMGI